MHVLLTGAAGSLGSHTLLYLLQRGHTVLALDRTDLPPTTLAQIASLPETVRSGYSFQKADLTDYEAFEQLVKTAQPAIQGVVHLGAIPQPVGLDARFVHNNNVVSSYNVLYTCAKVGITRIAQASSVNAPGLSYSPEGHHVFYQLPVTETTPLLPVGGVSPTVPASPRLPRNDSPVTTPPPRLPLSLAGGRAMHQLSLLLARLGADQQEDPYALSKTICEIQASSLVRLFPSLRIASLRFHMVKPTYADACTHSRWEDCFAWTSHDAAASSCLLSLTSAGWEGHEAFNIAAPEICWEGGLTPSERSQVPLEEKKGAVELIESMWKGRVKEEGFNRAWWDGKPRRSTWDSTKAERLLGWDHDAAPQAGL